jgi:membrane glycosyltransferase
MSPRHAAFSFLAILAAVAALASLAALLLRDGLGLLDALMLLALAVISPWIGLATANALIGLLIRLLARDPVAAVLPGFRRVPDCPAARTALAVCLRNEDMAGVLPALEPLLTGLPAAHYDLWFLSDTTAEPFRAAEDAAIEALRARHAEHAARIHLRRRERNIGFKAGNVMEFLENEGAGYAFFLCLDADSRMTPLAVARLVATMQASPRTAILQQLIVGRPVATPFPRLFQFGMRAGMRIWATGQAWWQQARGPYWGHNALIRVAPFREHGRLEALPDGSAILSHDQVEAVRLQNAGWGVWGVPEEEGSLEGNPPALPEFLARDLRWAEGNMQYLALLRAPGLDLAARWQLLQAVLLFACAPLWAVVFAAAALIAASGGFDAAPLGEMLGVFGLVWLLLHASKLAGYLEILAPTRRSIAAVAVPPDPGRAAGYGGRRRFMKGALAELAFSAMLQPIRVVHQTGFLLALPFGVRMGWKPQNRADRGVSWADAARLLWPHTLIGLLATGFVAATAPWALPFALLWAGGLLVAIPFCVMTTAPGFGRWLATRGLAAAPEEVQAASLSPSSAA